MVNFGSITLNYYDEYVKDLKARQEQLDEQLVSLTHNDKSFMITRPFLLEAATKSPNCSKVRVFSNSILVHHAGHDLTGCLLSLFLLFTNLDLSQCGAEFTAQEKFKKLKNGEFNRHVYYNCTRRVDINCTEKYINEKDFCELLQQFIENNYKQIDISDKLLAKVERHYQVTKTLFQHYQVEQSLDIPFLEYSRYVLTRGTEAERTIFAAGMMTKLKIKKGTIEIL